MFTNRTKRSILRALLTRRSPYYVQFYITGRCNLQCRQCNIVETNSRLREVSVDEIRTIAHNLARVGGGIVLLTGGEPFIRQDLPEIVAVFKDEGLDVRLQTAGLATTEQLQRCYDAGARDINVSLDSLVELKQDYINAVPGSWTKAIDALERISQVFNRGSAITSLGCVLSRFNYLEIPAILEFATRIGWHLSLVPVHIARPGEKMGFRSYDDLFCFRPEDMPGLEAVLERILAMKRHGALLFDSERFLRSSFAFIQTGRPTWRHKDVCDAPDLYFAVRPNGDFAVCCDHTLKEDVPSLLDDTFVERYRSGELRKRCAPTTKACEGCHYGSYPEVTLSVRDPRAFFDRVRLVFSQQRSRIVQDFAPGDFFRYMEEIRSRHADVYAAPASAELQGRLDAWRELETRRRLVQADAERRRLEGRIRGRPPREEVSADSP